MKCLTLFLKILSFYNYLIVDEKVTDEIDLRKNFFCQQKKTLKLFCVPYSLEHYFSLFDPFINNICKHFIK